MATRVSLANVARISVGVIAMAWALLGLGDALAAGMGRSVDFGVIAAVIANGLLIAAAISVFFRFHYWYAALVAATVVVTADRLLTVVGTADWWLGLSSVAMLLAVLGISAVARKA
jgi:hypothetical protein